MAFSMFRFSVLFVIVGLAALPVLAQVPPPNENPRASLSGQINGQVRYEGGAPVFNVLVSCDSFAGGLVGQAQTDRNGKFRFTNLGGAQYTITVRAPGYVEVRESVDLNRNIIQYLQITLRPDGSGATPMAPPAVIDPKVPAPARKEYEDGLKEVNAGKMDKAIPHLEKAVTLYPDFLEAQLLLGTARMDAKQWDKAEAALRRAIEIDPKRAEGYFALGELYYQQKKYPEAEKALLDGLKLQERSWQGHLTLGRVYYDMGDMSKAGPQVGKALVLKPDLAEARLLGGNILLRAHRPADALVQFEEYLRLEPKGKFAPQAREIVAKIKGGLAGKK